MGSHDLLDRWPCAEIDWSAAETDLAALSEADRVEAVDAAITVFQKATEALIYAAEGTCWADTWREGRFLISFAYFPDAFSVLAVRTANPLDNIPLGGFVISRDGTHRVIPFSGRKGDPACGLPFGPGNRQFDEALHILRKFAPIAALCASSGLSPARAPADYKLSGTALSVTGQRSLVCGTASSTVRCDAWIVDDRYRTAGSRWGADGISGAADTANQLPCADAAASNAASGTDDDALIACYRVNRVSDDRCGTAGRRDWRVLGRRLTPEAAIGDNARPEGIGLLQFVNNVVIKGSHRDERPSP